MLREWDMNEVSDGNFYTENDMVKVGCNDCEGCSSCCRDSGDTITLDPYDVFRFLRGLDMSVAELLDGYIALGVVDGVILPHLNLEVEKADPATGQMTHGCAFLNKQGRCSIHDFRPGICRLFPLGRIYEDGDFKYFLQVNECLKTNRTKVKVSKWLGEEDSKGYHEFLRKWHYYLRNFQDRIAEMEDTEEIKKISMDILTRFFFTPYEGKDIFSEIISRIEEK